MPRRSRAVRHKPRQVDGDVALVFDQTEDGEGFAVLRRRAADSPFEVGMIRPLKEGRAIDGEVVSMRPRKNVPLLFDVRVEVPETRRATSDGPAQVATEDYRRGWDAIWGRTPRPTSHLVN